MATYARVSAGVVVEMFIPIDAHKDMPLSELFVKELAAQMVDCSAVDGVAVGWTYDGTSFHPPT